MYQPIRQDFTVQKYKGKRCVKARRSARLPAMRTRGPNPRKTIGRSAHGCSRGAGAAGGARRSARGARRALLSQTLKLSNLEPRTSNLERTNRRPGKQMVFVFSGFCFFPFFLPSSPDTTPGIDLCTIDRPNTYPKHKNVASRRVLNIIINKRPHRHTVSPRRPAAKERLVQGAGSIPLVTYKEGLSRAPVVLPPGSVRPVDSTYVYSQPTPTKHIQTGSRRPPPARRHHPGRRRASGRCGRPALPRRVDEGPQGRALFQVLLSQAPHQQPQSERRRGCRRAGACVRTRNMIEAKPRRKGDP